MLRPFIYFLAVVMLMTSCIAFDFNKNVGDNSTLSRQDVENLVPNDKVAVRLNNGKFFSGKLAEIRDEYLVVKLNSRDNGNGTKE